MAKAGGSASGFHFLNSYQNCRHKWFIESVLRIKPKYEGRALLFGTAYHAGKEAFYKTKSIKRAISAFKKQMQDQIDKYRNEEDYEFDFERGPIVLQSWYEAYGKNDFDIYDILAVEEEIVIKFPFLMPNGNTVTFRFTMRVDLIVQQKGTNNVYIIDTKMTSSSWKKQATNCRLGDQATAYIYGVKSAFPDKNVRGFLPDISYWNKRATDESKIVNIRTDLVRRSNRELELFENKIKGILVEMNQHYEAYKQGVHWSHLFYTNTSHCFDFWQECPFVDICKRDELLTSKGPAPRGFIRERRRGNRFYEHKKKKT